MSKLKKKLVFETTFSSYDVDELIGEGGAGRVYGGTDPDGSAIALKVLAEDRVSSDKRRRFKNEVAFLSRNKHPNIVTVLDHGISRVNQFNIPFYVMPRYDGSLRDVMRERPQSEAILRFLGQILDGIEAAHLQNVVHRDLKPENILYQKNVDNLAVADFGIAQFNEDIVATLVETVPGQRLANFQYAAPEQRAVGQTVGERADIYALGLITNELFTGVVPHGTQYRQIRDVDQQFGFLDPLVSRMLSQSPADRPASIAEIKGLIQRYRAEAVSVQRISQIDGSVIKASEVDEPLALDPPRLVAADWNRGKLTLKLDRPVTNQWVDALQNMIGGRSSVMGKSPERFSFKGTDASIEAPEHEVQPIIDHFKTWLPQATYTLKHRLEAAAREREAHQRETLRREREEEETRLRVVKNIRI